MTTSDAQDSGDGAGRVLVIEASKTVALVICGLLKRLGLQADHADADIAAMREADVSGYDLIIAEPALLNAELMALRARAIASGVPWLAMLPPDSTHDGADADGWLRKPIRSEELQQAVMRCLGARPTDAVTGGVDIGAIERLWGSATDVGFRRVVETFVDEMAERLGVIAQAVEADDRRRLLIEAHSAGSAAANVGAMAMSRIARAMEATAAQADAARLRSLAADLATTCRRDLPILARLAAGETL